MKKTFYIFLIAMLWGTANAQENASLMLDEQITIKSLLIEMTKRAKIAQ